MSRSRGFDCFLKLRPYQSRIFVIDELEGFRVEFHLGSDGEVDELIFISRMERSWRGEPWEPSVAEMSESGLGGAKTRTDLVIYPDSLKSRDKFLAFRVLVDSDGGMIRGGFLSVSASAWSVDGSSPPGHTIPPFSNRGALIVSCRRKNGGRGKRVGVHELPDHL
jgi:hypothetical protein